jgi:ribonuclease HI
MTTRNTLEICTDASTKEFPNKRVFGCAGAVCINTGESRYIISQDTTNNRSELIAIYTGIKLAEDIILANPGVYTDIKLYSDSQFGIFGLTKWMDSWLSKRDDKGVMYGSNNKPVKNQELFKAIITYLTTHNLRVRMLHQSGHVNCKNSNALAEANKVFCASNGFLLDVEDIYKISKYNDIVDKESRRRLQDIDPDQYPIADYSGNYTIMCNYVIPNDYKYYVS